MVYHAARMRLRRPVDVSAPGLTRHLWAGLPFAPAKGRGADAGSFVPQERTASPHTFAVCLFLLLRAGPLTPTTSSSDHGSPCCTDEAETSGLSRRSDTVAKTDGAFSPSPARHLWLVYPLRSKGLDTGREAAGQRAPSTETPPVTRRERSKRNCISEL